MTAPRGRPRWDALVRVAIANPVAFFFIFRWLTWLMAIVVLYSRSTPPANRINEPGLVMFTALQLALGTLYASVLHPRLARSSDGLKVLSPPADLIAAGVADMMVSLVVVYFSGGWGSPFWHLAVTSVLVPCFLLAPVWGLATVAAFTGAYTLLVFLAGSMDTALAAGQRNMFIGNLVTAYLVAIAITYLGSVFRALRAERARTRRALDETDALFQLTQNVVQSGVDTDELLTRLAQVFRASGLFPMHAVFLCDERGALRLGASSVGVEELPLELAQQAVAQRCTVTSDTRSIGELQVAAPLLAGEELMGVMVVGARVDGRLLSDPKQMAEAMAGHVAIGIRNTTLARRMADIAAHEERSRVAREIHDGIAQSIYMLSLHLETSAELAGRPRQDMKERLENLVALSKQTLLEVRHYIFDLKPYLAGEKGVATMVENQVREFSKVAGIPAELETSGEERQAPVAVATCLYRVAQEALANAFKHARASRVDVRLEFTPDAVQLVVRDDGRGFDGSAVVSGHGLSNMRLRAEELGGEFSLETAPGAGTRVSVRLPC